VKFRRLGESELYVSEISLGTWFSNESGIGGEQSRRCIAAAFDAGINFFDTANVYGLGASERLLAESLAGHRRTSYMLATKAFFPMSETDRGMSKEQVVKQLEGSLKRLKTDYIDLYYCHRFDPQVQLEETMGALTRAVEVGRVRYLGFSEWTASQVEQAGQLSDHRRLKRFSASQPQYSMLWRKPEAELFAACERRGIGQVVFSPLAQGALTGKYKPGAPPPPDSRAAHDSMNMFMEVKGRRFRSDDVLAAVQNLAPIAADLGITMGQLALAWVLRRGEVASAIIGASRPEQVAENAQASGVILSAEILDRIDVALRPVAVT
jgi:aryl-alcohol dehydrogenase-like predicted oxidoreductase